MSRLLELLETKLAISAGTTLSLLQQRAAQGARIAPSLMHGAEQAAVQGLAHTPTSMRRTALGAGEAVRAQQATHSLLQNPVTQSMQQRVHGAIQSEAAGAATRTGQPLSRGYEGYMTPVQRAYSPEHMGQVLGTSPVHLPVGETMHMKSLGMSGSIAPAATATHSNDVTAVTPRSGVRSIGTAMTPIRQRAM